MAAPKVLTPEEETRCVKFLRLLGITRHDDRFLSDRGYFGMYLCGLKPEEVGEQVHPDQREFREMIHLLSLAGVEQIRNLLQRRMKENIAATMRSRTPLVAAATPVPLRAPAQVASRTPTPDPSLLSPRTPVPVAAHGPSVEPMAKTHYQKEIGAIKPNVAEMERMRALRHAETEAEAIALANDYGALGEYQDAYHILFDYLMVHPVRESVLTAMYGIIQRANAFNRDEKRPPYNMLYECEELAALLVKRIPDLRLLKELDASTTEIYQIVKMVYRMWASHCNALLEYKYRISQKSYVVRNWIDPREFGFLVEVMRMAIRSGLPLDLLRFVYEEIKHCLAIGNKVIAHEDKRSQFYAECLRFIASPARDVIPDLQFEIYREIIYCYLKEGDSANALTFTKQALMIRKQDREMQRLEAELKSGLKKT